MSTAPLRLQPATAGDLPRLLVMMEAFNRLEGIDWDPVSIQPAASRLIADPALGAIGLIACEADPIGYFVLSWGYDLEWRGRDAYLTELYVDPAWRGRQVGTQALALIEDLGRANGASAMHLMVRPENEPAVRLYASAGYRSPPRLFLTKTISSAHPVRPR
jgi:ribosomal protein S18 acetylase RimI-like enzyme